MSTPTQQVINVGAAPNDGQGDPLRTAFIKTNNNVANLFAYFQTSVPPTLIGSVGDFAGMVASDSTYFYYCFANYDGSSIIWAQVTQVANVTISSITNGNSNVSIPIIDGNAIVSINGTSDVAKFYSGGLSVTSTIYSDDIIANAVNSSNITSLIITANSLVGNVLGGNNANSMVQIANNLSAIGNITSRLFNGNRVSVSGNVFGGNLRTTGYVSAAGNIFSNSIIIANNVSYARNLILSNDLITANGNLLAANITSNNIIFASGNILTNSSVSASGDIITDGFFIGNFQGNIIGNVTVPGANTEVMFNTNGNIDAVAGFTYDKSSNLVTVLGNISAQGNITATNFLGVISNAAYADLAGNANFANVANTVSVNAQPNITSVGILDSLSVTSNIAAGNLSVSGQVVSFANVTGYYFIGNGSQLTGLPVQYDDANVTSLLANFGSNTISTYGDIFGGNLFTPGWVSVASNVTANIFTGVRVSVSGNVYGGNLRTTGYVSATGNIFTANNVNVLGNVLLEKNVISNSVVYANVAVSTIGNIIGGNIVLNGATSGYTGFNANATSSNVTYNLPAGDGSLNQSLTTDGAGTLNWSFALPAGTLLDFAGNVAPSGFLVCDGNTVSQTTYAALYAAIGNLWNTGGESVGDFRLPDFRRRVAVGSGGTLSATLGNAVGNLGGSETHTLTTSEIPSHTHTVSGTTYDSASGTADQYIVGGGTGGTYTGNTSVGADATGGGGAHNNVQPSAIVLKIIKT